MKKIFITAILLLGILVTQTYSQPRFDPKEMLKKLQSELELSDSQSVAIEKILNKQREKVDDIRDSFDGDRMEIMGELRKLRDETDNEIKAVLSEEQALKYDQFKEKNRNRRMGNRR